MAVAKHWATASMHMLHTAVPQYDAKTDFLVAKRGAAVEVWTKRAFKKHEIIFAPVSTVVKDHYWTKGRPVLLQGGSALHPSHKHFVIERERVRAEDVSATFALFWAVERTDASSEANLHLQYPQMGVAASVVLPNEKKAVAAAATHAAALVPPVLTNKTPVAKYTRLVASTTSTCRRSTRRRSRKGSKRGPTRLRPPRKSPSTDEASLGTKTTVRHSHDRWAKES